MTTATPSVASGCSFSKFTATASAQVAQIAACATAVGDVTIYGAGFGNIDLTGTEQFYGNLVISNATQVSAFNAPTLELVSGELTFNGSTILETINLAVLTTVGTLTINACSQLDTLDLTTGITSADNITIADTALTTLEGINVVELKIFNVNNNKDITTINSGLQSVTDSLAISYNAQGVNVTLDQLSSAYNIYLQDVGALSLSNLTTVNSSLVLDNCQFETLEIKNLTSIGNSLTITDNSDLTDISFPALTAIKGAFIIENDDSLSTIDGFPVLKSVSGSVSLDGSLDNVTFPELTKVYGSFNLTSTGELSCNQFEKENKDLTVSGLTNCVGKTDSTSSSGTLKSSSSGSSSETGSSSSTSSSTKKSDASSASVAYLTPFLAAFMAVGAAVY